MSAPGAHPPGDIWPGILDTYRCDAAGEDGRCQLYRGHDGAHGHAVSPPTANLPVHRWDDGRAWSEPPSYGLPWCCMFAR